MKGSKYLFFMLILIYSLINISGTNSPKEIRNLEPINDGKRTLSEQFDNYVIIVFNEDVTYKGREFLYHNGKNYNKNISYIKIGNQTIYPDSNFTSKNNTKIEVHFNQTITDLASFFNVDFDENFNLLISGNFCNFDTSSVTIMNGMFYGCSSLQTLYLSNLKHHQ